MTPSSPRARRAVKAPSLAPPALEALARFRKLRPASRPISTLAWAVCAGLAGAWERPGIQPGQVERGWPREAWLGALFDDWRIGMEPWSEEETRAGVAVLGQILIDQRAVLPPLPAFPAEPALTPAVLDVLWHHLDLAGWRVLRFTTAAKLHTLVDQKVLVGRLLMDGAAVLDQFDLMRVQAFTAHAASARDYTEELASLLHRIHAELDRAAQAAGADPLGWPIPDYQPFAGSAYPIPAGPRGSTLPRTLIRDLQKALDARHCPRPMATVLPMLQYYVDLKESLDPGWTWSPSRDGRECSFILLESGLEDLPDWTSAQAREFTQLCTAVHAWSQNQPNPPLPPLALDPTLAGVEILWRHQDILFLVGSVLGVALGIIPREEASPALKRERRLHHHWLELQTMLWGTLYHWAMTTPEDRSMLARTLPAAVGAVYQEFRNQIAKVDRAFLRFIPKPPENLLPRAKTAMMRFARAKKR